MSLLINGETIEKNFCVTPRNPSFFVENEDFFLKNLNSIKTEDQAFFKRIDFTEISTETLTKNNLEELSFLSKSPEILEIPYNFHISDNDMNDMDFIWEKNNFISPDFGDIMENTRRKRRKFASEEERRIARILKNRRTAEESRQRRIHKMRTLENFVSLSEEREKMIKEELRLIGIQSAFRTVELILSKKKKEWG
jgi:hypothetical protein|eukprot:Tamp_06912.p2 GENE.Tamp_06912~~Tamp_06912.p2  ORF type:complete len:196 (-),score=27.03 Tamp_06912:1994-2581(-)